MDRERFEPFVCKERDRLLGTFLVPIRDSNFCAFSGEDLRGDATDSRTRARDAAARRLQDALDAVSSLLD